jgi:hypothetical protein
VNAGRRVGFAVRDCASFGLPAPVQHLCHDAQDNQRLLDDLKEVLGAG